MMTNTAILLLLPLAAAFSPQRGYPYTTKLASVLEDSKLEPIDFDLERAKQCAENFGSCSVEEMEMLRDRLHKEHLEAFIMGHPETTAQPEEAFEHRLIEEELSLQLSLLKEQMHDEKTLFPKGEEAEEAVEETIKVMHPPIPAPANELLVKEGKAMMMLDEETLEAAMICAVIAALAIGVLNI